MKIFYWNKKRNFGDELGGLLLKRFAHINSEWSEPEKSDIAVVGSILHYLPRNYSGIIAGCGKLHEKTKFDFPEAKVLGLRGYLTAAGVKGDYAIGDPGLLADELVPLEEKEWNLGVVPHWSDTKLEFNETFLKYSPKIIRVTDDPLKVISEIGRCKKIVSSSLHGIVLADAFQIPRRIEIPPSAYNNPGIEGGLFKWHDYASSLDMKLLIGETHEPDRRRVVEKQHELFDMFEEIRSIFKPYKTSKNGVHK
jgi:pyruvyltransferase